MAMIYALTNVPSPALYIKTFEMEDAFAFLESRGFKLNDAEKGPQVRTEGRVRVENVTKTAEPEFRAVTKIALNYVAAVLGYTVALLPAFDDARNFARYGREKARVRVYAYENPWFTGRRGHYVSLTRSEEMVVVQLSILLRTQYFVVLASDRDVPVRATAHFFDLTANRLKEMDPRPIRPGRPLKAVKA